MKNTPSILIAFFLTFGLVGCRKSVPETVSVVAYELTKGLSVDSAFVVLTLERTEGKDVIVRQVRYPVGITTDSALVLLRQYDVRLDSLKRYSHLLTNFYAERYANTQ